MDKFTTPPWVVNGARVENEQGALVAGVFDGSFSEFTNHQTQEANANLISAAPDLFKALEYALENCCLSSNAEKYAELALKKAKGEINVA